MDFEPDTWSAVDISQGKSTLYSEHTKLISKNVSV